MHKAEAISLILWDPATGIIDTNWPAAGSPLRLEEFSRQVERAYVERYKGLPPHKADDDPAELENDADSSV